MLLLARGISQIAKLQVKLNRLSHVKIPGLVKWCYTLGEDWSGDPAIFFWIILTDAAAASGARRFDRLLFTLSSFDFVGHRALEDRRQSYVKKWSRTEVQSHIDTTTKAFATGKTIRDERLAKDYLISMLFRER
jgi:hypothetical protein